MHPSYVHQLSSPHRFCTRRHVLLNHEASKYFLRLSLQLVEFFGIEKSPEEVGLLFRVREKNYTFIWDTCELVPDCLYFLYFKEQGQLREVSRLDFIFL
jgi:hypothetical protein